LRARQVHELLLAPALPHPGMVEFLERVS